MQTGANEYSVETLAWPGSRHPGQRFGSIFVVDEQPENHDCNRNGQDTWTGSGGEYR